jgi:hypothetical protein
MRIVVHLIAPSADQGALAAAVATLSAVRPAGTTHPHDDGRRVSWSIEVARDEHGWELEVNRLIAELGEVLQPAVAAGNGVEIEVEIGRADRAQMNSHVGLACPPELLTRLGAWGIELAVTSDRL